MKNLITPVEESNAGIYVWEMPNGQWIGDDEGNFLTIPARKGSLRAIDLIAKEAEKYVGKGVGKPLFLANRRQITDAELDEQLARQDAGLIPDPYDFAAYEEELKHGRAR